MLDDNDIKKLIVAQKEVFVTKEEMEHLIDIVATKDEISDFRNEMNKRFDSLDQKLDKVDVIEKEVEYIRNTLSIPAFKK